MPPIKRPIHAKFNWALCLSIKMSKTVQLSERWSIHAQFNCAVCLNTKLSKDKGVLRWDHEGTISSDYLAQCPRLVFMSIRIEFSASYTMLSQGFVIPTSLIGQVVYKPSVLSVSSEALMLITAILIPAANCVLLLHQLVIGLVTVHLM